MSYIAEAKQSAQNDQRQSVIICLNLTVLKYLVFSCADDFDRDRQSDRDGRDRYVFITIGTRKFCCTVG